MTQAAETNSPNKEETDMTDVMYVCIYIYVCAHTETSFLGKCAFFFFGSLWLFEKTFTTCDL